MSSRSDHCLIVVGSGPGIGSHVAKCFAEKKYNKIALLARNREKLAKDKAAVEAVLPNQLTVKTYSVDISGQEDFTSVLKQVQEDLGAPECVYFNAAVVQPSKLLETDESDFLFDFKVNCIALHTVARWAIPWLLQLASSDSAARPALLVTNSHLPEEPEPEVYVLSMMKAAQKNLVLSLAKTYQSQGIQVGLVTVTGPVDPANKSLNPVNIASKAWELHQQPQKEQKLEVRIVE